MSKTSKTARASMGVVVKEKKVIPDEVYIKNLRNDLDSGLYVAQEGARALLRAHDAALATIGELNEQNNGLHSQLSDFVASNKALTAELEAAKKVIVELEEQLSAAQGAAAQYHTVLATANACSCRGIAHNAECVLSRRSDA